MSSGRPDRVWRRACVVRAQTVAADIRLLDLAVEPAGPELGPGALLDVIVEDAGVVSIHRHASMPIGPGLLRISVRRGPGTRHGLRFLWSLVEGATMRFCSRPSTAPLVDAGIRERRSSPAAGVPAKWTKGRMPDGNPVP